MLGSRRPTVSRHQQHADSQKVGPLNPLVAARHVQLREHSNPELVQGRTTAARHPHDSHASCRLTGPASCSLGAPANCCARMRCCGCSLNRLWRHVPRRRRSADLKERQGGFRAMRRGYCGGLAQTAYRETPTTQFPGRGRRRSAHLKKQQRGAGLHRLPKKAAQAAASCHSSSPSSRHTQRPRRDERRSELRQGFRARGGHWGEALHRLPMQRNTYNAVPSDLSL